MTRYFPDSSAVLPVVLPGRRPAGHGEMEGSAHLWRGFEPDAPVLPFDNALHDRQPHAFAAPFRRVDVLKHLKDLAAVVRRDADAVVLDGKDRRIVRRGGNFDHAGPLRIETFQRVADQVREDLAKCIAVGANGERPEHPRPASERWAATRSRRQRRVST